MFSVLIGALLNIILDPIFIFWFDMGVKGAALATVLSQACSAVWVVSFLFSRRAFGETIYGTGPENYPFHISFRSIPLHYGKYGESGWVCPQ